LNAMDYRHEENSISSDLWPYGEFSVSMEGSWHCSKKVPGFTPFNKSACPRDYIEVTVWVLLTISNSSLNWL
jgi:hypothetical protein